MKKLIILTIVLSFLCANASYSTEYYCKYKEGNTTHIKYGFNPQDSIDKSCSWTKSFGNDYYNNCINEYTLLQKAYKDGNCEQVLEEKVNINGSECTIKTLAKSKQNAGYSCVGGNTSDAMKTLKLKYR